MKTKNRKISATIIRSGLLVWLAVVVTFLVPDRAFSGDGQPDQARSGESFFSEVGIISGHGWANIPEGRYRTVPLIGHFGMDLKKCITGLGRHQGRLSVFFEPQINLAYGPKNDLEVGLGLGLQYAYPFTERFSLYALGSVGPHYITVETQKQANGFLFADTFGLGAYFYLTPGSALNVGYRFRHMSNADIKSPNAGIDSNFGIVGYSVFFD